MVPINEIFCKGLKIFARYAILCSTTKYFRHNGEHHQKGVYFIVSFFVQRRKNMRVNGKDVRLSEPLDLLSYLSQAGFNVQRVVVERNGAIITREHFAETLLADDDSLEVVQFVGGG